MLNWQGIPAGLWRAQMFSCCLMCQSEKQTGIGEDCGTTDVFLLKRAQKEGGLLWVRVPVQAAVSLGFRHSLDFSAVLAT